MATKVINTILNLKNASMISGLQQVEGSVNSLTGSMGRFVRKGKVQWGAVLNSVDRFATGALMGVGTAGAAFTAFSVKTGAEFESSMSNLAATMGTTVDQIDDLKQTALKMGDSTRFTATEAADGLNILAQAGLNTKDQISSIKPVLDLAAAGNLGLAESASYLTGVTTGFGDEMSNAAKYADMIAAGATTAKTDVNQFGTAMEGAIAAHSTYNQSAEETASALLRMADGGETGMNAANGLLRVMGRLYTPTDKAKEAMEDIGVSAFDSSGNARAFSDVIDDLQGALAGMSDEQQNAYLSTIIGKSAMQDYAAIVKDGADKVDAINAALESASDGQGAAAQQAATQADNLSGAIDMLKSRVSTIGIEFYERLSGPAKDAINQLTDTLGQLDFTPLMDGLAGLVTGGIDLLTNALAFLAEHGNTIIQVMPTVVTAIAGLKGATTAAKGIAPLISAFTKSRKEGVTLFSVLTGGNPVFFALKVAMVVLPPIIMLIVTHWKQLVAWFNKFKAQHPMIVAGFKAIWSVIKAIINPIGTLLGHLRTLGSKLGGIASKAKSAFGKVKDLIGIGGSSALDGNANGTSYYGGGWTRINERGGEVAYLPSGSTIIPADKSAKIASAMGGRSTVVNITVQGNVIGNEEYADYLGNYIVNELAEVM